MSTTSLQKNKNATPEQKKLVQHNNQHTPHAEAQQKHEPDQAQRSLKETLINWLPRDPNTFLFELVVVTYLIVAVIHFIFTGDTSMLMTLLPYIAAYVGFSEVKPLFSRRKGGQ
jgi:hypothetical protein